MCDSSLRRMQPLFQAIGAALALVILFVAAPASAQSGGGAEDEKRELARQLYNEGQEHMQAGRVEAAVEKWFQAYEVQPVPLFLFSIAQAYRQQGACSHALYFYQRYLADDLDSQYSEVAEQHAKQLASQCEPKSPWADGDDDTRDEDDKDDVDDEDDEDRVVPTGPAPEPAPAEPIAPPMVTAFVEAGPAFASMGELEVPVLTSVRAGVAYPVVVGPVEVQAGAASTFTPVPWSRSGESGTALLTGLMANAAARYPVAPQIFARGELGLGALIFSGISHENSVFIEPGLSATGALGMFHMRAQVAAEYELTPNLVVSLSPLALSFSPAHAGLRNDIGTLMRFEVLGGVSVRL